MKKFLKKRNNYNNQKDCGDLIKICRGDDNPLEISTGEIIRINYKIRKKSQ